MIRKIYLAQSLLSLLVAVSLAQPDCSREMDAEVLILGAGFAGLGAAQALSAHGMDDFILIEARSEVGGRAQSMQFGGINIEIGPQWLVATNVSRPELNPLYATALRCNTTLRAFRDPAQGLLRVYTRDGQIAIDALDSFVRFNAATSQAGQIVGDLRETGDDLSATAGLRAGGWTARNAIDEFVEFFNVELAFADTAGSLGYIGTFGPDYLREVASLGTTGWIVNGYRDLAQCLADEIFTADDPRLVLNTRVQSVAWSDECVCVTAMQNGGEREYCGRYAIPTFSIGVLQNQAVRFEPSLPLPVANTINRLLVGRFLKIYAEFDETFWDTDVDFIGIANEIEGRDYYPLWTPWGALFSNDTPVIQTFLFGEFAERIDRQDREITRRQIGQVLRNVYGDAASDPINIEFGRYQTNPLFYGNIAGVSTPGISNRSYELLNEPIGNMFLAGDGIAYSHRSAAHGAMISGINTGRRVVSAMTDALPPVVTFVNNSPRVSGRTISADFIVSKPVQLLECSLDREPRMDCSSGSVVYEDLAPGVHRLRIIARNEDRNDRGVALVGMYISDEPHCATQLINAGARVSEEGTVTVEFTSTGSLPATFSCRVDRAANVFPCASPLVLDSLSSGVHRIQIEPVCEGDQRTTTVTVTVP